MEASNARKRGLALKYTQEKSSFDESVSQEDDGLKQKKQIKVEQISRLHSRLMLGPVNYTVDWAYTDKEDISVSRLIHWISRLLSMLVD